MLMYVLLPFSYLACIILASTTFRVDAEYSPTTQFEVVEDVWLAPFKFLRASNSPNFEQFMSTFLTSVSSESMKGQIQSLVSDLNNSVNDLRKDVIAVVLDVNQVPTQLKLDILTYSLRELNHVVECSLLEKDEEMFEKFNDKMNDFVCPTVSVFRTTESGEEELYANFTIPRSLDDLSDLCQQLHQN